MYKVAHHITCIHTSTSKSFFSKSSNGWGSECLMKPPCGAGLLIQLLSIIDGKWISFPRQRRAERDTICWWTVDSLSTPPKLMKLIYSFDGKRKQNALGNKTTRKAEVISQTWNEPLSKSFSPLNFDVTTTPSNGTHESRGRDIYPNI